MTDKVFPDRRVEEVARLLLRYSLFIKDRKLQSMCRDLLNKWSNEEKEE